MRILQKVKDGGSESPVDAYFLFELKGLCSVALLKFNKGTRQNYHSHAFNAFTWFLKGDMLEVSKSQKFYEYKRSLIPKFTSRDTFHKVLALRDSWCLTIRGPWGDEWMEWNPDTHEFTILTNGRKVVRQGLHEEITSS